MQKLIASCDDRHGRTIELWLHPQQKPHKNGFVYPLEFRIDGLSGGFVSDPDHAYYAATMKFDMEVTASLLSQLSAKHKTVEPVISRLKEKYG